MNNNVTAQYASCYDLLPFVFFFMCIRVLSIKVFFGYLGYRSIFKQQRYFYDSLCPSLCQLTLTKVILSFPPLFPIVFCLFVCLSICRCFMDNWYMFLFLFFLLFFRQCWILIYLLIIAYVGVFFLSRPNMKNTLNNIRK